MTETKTRDESSSRPSRNSGSDGFFVGRWLQAAARFVREVVAELRKVIWPSRQELVTYTIVVVVFVVILVSIVAGLDIGFAKLVLWIFG
ncbi:MAG: preprotein translocase subunit SecE [Actinomycetota bacterium]|nr:preprotein translocase subunit SecE [Actinomycetota bacterium]